MRAVEREKGTRLKISNWNWVRVEKKGVDIGGKAGLVLRLRGSGWVLAAVARQVVKNHEQRGHPIFK